MTDAAAAGPVHRAFLAALPWAWRHDPNVLVFSRMLWMKRGWLPISIGFHLDWGATPEHTEHVETIVANFGGLSFTEFAVGTLRFPDALGPRERGGFVDAAVAHGEVATRTMEAERLYRFDNESWHRPTASVGTGWRLLVRAIRGLPEGRRPKSPESFTTVRNDFLPHTPLESARHAPYRT